MAIPVRINQVGNDFFVIRDYRYPAPSGRYILLVSEGMLDGPGEQPGEQQQQQQH